MVDRLVRFLVRGMVSCLVIAPLVMADETRQSPYLPKITDHEDFVYVWTRGIEGGTPEQASDKLVTIGTNPKYRRYYAKVVSKLAVKGRHEANQIGFTPGRNFIWAAGLDDSMVYLINVSSNPARPWLKDPLSTFEQSSGGVVGPHTLYPIPGRMLVSGLSNSADNGGRTALVEYSFNGRYMHTFWMPDDAPYGYDVRVNVNLNRLLTSSFTGRENYMRPLPELLADDKAMKRFGNTVVVWDFLLRKPIQTLEVPGAPLGIRWALQPRHYYAFTITALTSKLWGIFRKDDGTFEATALATIGDPEKMPLPVDISLSADDRYLFVTTFGDGKVRVYDVSTPRTPKLIYEHKIGTQVSAVSQSWDGKRVYFTSSLFSKWDKPDTEHFLKAFSWDGKQLSPLFELDFLEERIGYPHAMNFVKLNPGQRQALEESGLE